MGDTESQSYHADSSRVRTIPVAGRPLRAQRWQAWALRSFAVSCTIAEVNAEDSRQRARRTDEGVSK